MKSKIYLNDELVGYSKNPVEFTQQMREKRRKGILSNQMNIAYYENHNEIFIFTDSGRARRPLIIVENGIPRLNKNHLYKLGRGLLEWDDLINNGIIEFLDADEEENSYIAMSLADLNEEHTHLEIDPATMLGICAGIIPFSDHNSSPRNTMEAGMAKQALGLYISNYAMRTDVRAHLLHYLQTPIVKTRIIDSTNYDLRPSGQNFVVALMSYEGYNMEDAMVINKASLERGLARSSFFRAYDTSEKRYAGGQVDRFEVPDRNIKGYRSDEAYRNLDEDGIIYPESEVGSGDVLIGVTSPPRFLDEFSNSFPYGRRETSLIVRLGEKGIVDDVLISETSEGSRMAKIRVRDTRQPELGDKFASRHGQKGVIGLIVPPEDIPFTELGIVPDLIVNPHAIPSRMSIGYILEMVAGKAGSLEGERVDATPFNQTLVDDIKQQLINHGFESAGCESLYDGVTGNRFEAEIFIGVTYYQKLHHMTTDKVFARSRGPVQVLTHQPTEGRSREGGLRFGEMERDCLVAHGAAITLKERLLDEADKYEAIVCENCGMLAVYDRNRNKKYCPICDDMETYPVEMSYAFKLFLDELKSLCIFPKLILGDKTDVQFKNSKARYIIKPKYSNISRKLTRRKIKRRTFKNVIPENEKYQSLSSEFDNSIKDKEHSGEKSESDSCIICGKKLNENQKNLCRSCSRKQYASKIIRKLSQVVKPGILFKDSDLKSLNLMDLQIKDFIWTLQEYNLIDGVGNKYKLKDEDTLNNFIIESKLEPIDFNNIQEDSRLDKTCKTCGKTLPISEFYKKSDGYEDVCKNCKKLIKAAMYLNDVIGFFGFDSEFSESELKKHIFNENYLMGMIWSLQDNDLLIQKTPNSYILAEKSKCLYFLERYYDENEEQQSIPEIPVEKPKKEKHSINEIPMEKSKKEQSSLNVDKLKQMDDIIEAMKAGNSRKEAADMVNVPLYKVNHWYNEGRDGFGKDNINFYKKIKRIENKTKKQKSEERMQMDFVLKMLKQGKSRQDAAKVAGIKITKISSWISQGRDKHDKDTIYFYNEMNKIRDKEKNSRNKSKSETKNAKLIKSKKSAKKSKNKKKKQNIEFDSKKEVNTNKFSSIEERSKMDIVLNALKNGSSRHEAAEKASIPISQISSWEMNGKLGYSENTIYFINELKIITNNKEKSQSNIDDFNVKKVKEVKSQSSIDDFNVKKVKEVKSQKIKSIPKNKNENKIKSTKINNRNEKIVKNESSNKEEININDEREVMDSIIKLMRNGDSRVKASQKVGIKVGQILIWYRQGSQGYSENTIYFYNQLNIIEKK